VCRGDLAWFNHLGARACLVGWPTAACGDLGPGFEIGDHADDVLGDQSAERPAGIDGVQDLAIRRQQETRSGVFRFTIPNHSPWKISTGSFGS
jgi:hypothetical protein